MNEKLHTVTGRVNIKIWDGKTGKLKIDDTHDNLIVTTGLQHIADQLSDKSELAMSHMAIGTGTTAAVLEDIAMEIELDRNPLTSIAQGPSIDANKVVYVADWAAGDGTGAITETGLFNDEAAGVMLARSVFAVKNKGADDPMTITWTLTV